MLFILMQLKDQNYRIIVIGGDHYNTYGIVRSLGESGLKSDVLILDSTSKDSFVLRSRYVNNGLGCSTHAETIEYLLKGYDNTSKNIIICCSDEAEEFVLHNYKELSSCFVLPVCKDYEETIRLMNKDAITELANQHGIRVPKTWEVYNRRLPSGVEYPCITKPLTSTSGHKSDIVVCWNEKELRDVIEDSGRCSDYIVQQYIKFEKEISILGAVLANGEVILSGCIDKLRTCMIGTTSFGVMVDNSLLGDNIPKLRDMMSSTGYRGLFSAEFIVKDGAYYFLEVNFRNDGNTYVSTASGNNLPLLYVNSILGVEGGQKEPIYPCFFMLETEDFMTLRHNRVSIVQWRRDLKKANTCLVYNKQDIKPFRKKVRKTIISTMRRVWHKFAFV